MSGPAGSGRPQTFPRRLLPSTDNRIGKDRTGPHLDERSPYFSMVIPIRKSAPVLSRTRAPLRWDSRHPKGRRIQLHSSARGSLRGVTSDSSYGVAEHGADGPARRSSSVGRTWWTGPPPSSFAAGCRGPRQDGQAAKTKLLPRSCLRFWTRAWGQRELADERTGRLKKPRSIAGFVQGWAGHPSHPRPIQLTSQGTPDLDV